MSEHIDDCSTWTKEIPFLTSIYCDCKWYHSEYNIHCPLPFEIRVAQARATLPYVKLLTHDEMFGKEAEAGREG